ncbi:MAG: putative quinol monooxygenase [Bacillota bacterium]|nr:putative quinol monooxygenase [Bacillota bacterium]
MIVKSVTFHVKTEYIEEFIEATLENQENSRKEEGILGFDFLQCTDEPTKFLLYESYKAEEDMDKHLETEHFKKWISIVEPYFIAPREKVAYVPVNSAK